MSATNPSMSWGIPRTNPDARVHLHEHPRLERTGARSRSIEHVTVHDDAPGATSASQGAQERCGDT